MHLNFAPNSHSADRVHFDDFLKVDIRIGTIIEVQDFPDARKPSYKLKIDLGLGVGIKNSSAQITHHYNAQELVGKKVLAVVNFSPKQIGKFLSEVLVLGVSDARNEIVLFNLDHEVPNGARLH